MCIDLITIEIASVSGAVVGFVCGTINGWSVWGRKLREANAQTKRAEHALKSASYKLAAAEADSARTLGALASANRVIDAQQSVLLKHCGRSS